MSTYLEVVFYFLWYESDVSVAYLCVFFPSFCRFLSVLHLQVTEQHIKPVTRDAGKMSWALMLNPRGLDCDLFISHLATWRFLDGGGSFL